MPRRLLHALPQRPLGLLQVRNHQVTTTARGTGQRLAGPSPGILRARRVRPSPKGLHVTDTRPRPRHDVTLGAPPPTLEL